MTQQLLDQLKTELHSFTKLNESSSIKTITDAYNQALGSLQRLMLTNENPDTHVRAWNLLTKDAYKELSKVQGGLTGSIEELKHKVDLQHNTGQIFKQHVEVAHHNSRKGKDSLTMNAAVADCTRLQYIQRLPG